MIKLASIVSMLFLIGSNLFAQTVTIKTYSIKHYTSSAPNYTTRTTYKLDCGESKPCWYDNIAGIQLPVFKSGSRVATDANIQALARSFKNGNACYIKAVGEITGELSPVREFSEYFYPEIMAGQGLQLRAISLTLKDGTELSTDCI